MRNLNAIRREPVSIEVEAQAAEQNYESDD